ncbi:MAG: hypothetical protein IJX39_06640 [Clostridia bacterium]|nr:hypothetical protein [Clostridia bacterium]
MENKEFHYTYKASTEAQRREIANIRKQYSAPEDCESKLERLRRLDERVKNLSTMIPLVVGIIGCLIMGLGMTMVLEWELVVWGVILSVIGVLVMIPAYPLYRYVLRYCKKTYGPEILRLSEELLGENEADRKKGQDV